MMRVGGRVDNVLVRERDAEVGHVATSLAPTPSTSLGGEALTSSHDEIFSHEVMLHILCLMYTYYITFHSIDKIF